jgi:hypothetical protein
MDSANGSGGDDGCGTAAQDRGFRSRWWTRTYFASRRLYGPKVPWSATAVDLGEHSRRLPGRAACRPSHATLRCGRRSALRDVCLSYGVGIEGLCRELPIAGELRGPRGCRSTRCSTAYTGPPRRRADRLTKSVTLRARVVTGAIRDDLQPSTGYMRLVRDHGCAHGSSAKLKSAAMSPRSIAAQTWSISARPSRRT